MNKIKDIQVDKLFNNKITPYMIVLAVMSFFHIYCYEICGDDYVVLCIIRPNIWEEIKNIPRICNGWSGRYIINPFIHIFMHFDYRIWLVLELFFLMCIFNMIKKYVICSDRIPFLYMLAASMCTLTLLDYYEVGWRVVTITYIWVAIAAMVACLSIVKSFKDIEIKKCLWIVYIILTFVATNKEEMSVMFVLIFTTASIMLIKAKKKSLLVIVQTGISYLSLCGHLFSPNNHSRYEMKKVVAAQSHTFFDRAVIGVSTTFRHLLFEYNYGFLCMALVIALVIWLSKKNIVPRLVSLVPLLLWFMIWVPGEIDYMFGTNTTGGPRVIATIILGIIALISIIASLYYIYGFGLKLIWVAVFLVAGIAGRFVVGFGNSGWQRYERTYTFLYIVMIAITALVACDVWDQLTYRKKRVLFGVVMVLGVVGVFKNMIDLGAI